MRIGKTKTPCEFAGAVPLPPEPESKIGIALSTLGQRPINGLRHRPHGDTCGWYIWCGEELSEAADFFSPLHVTHISEYLAEVVEYLDLPPGYRFLVDGDNWEDIWYDASLLQGHS